jgi:hypothetical protein
MTTADTYPPTYPTYFNGRPITVVSADIFQVCQCSYNDDGTMFEIDAVDIDYVRPDGSVVQKPWKRVTI